MFEIRFIFFRFSLYEIVYRGIISDFSLSRFFFQNTFLINYCDSLNGLNLLQCENVRVRFVYTLLKSNCPLHACNTTHMYYIYIFSYTYTMYLQSLTSIPLYAACRSNDATHSVVLFLSGVIIIILFIM